MIVCLAFGRIVGKPCKKFSSVFYVFNEILLAFHRKIFKKKKKIKSECLQMLRNGGQSADPKPGCAGPRGLAPGLLSCSLIALLFWFYFCFSVLGRMEACSKILMPSYFEFEDVVLYLSAVFLHHKLYSGPTGYQDLAQQRPDLTPKEQQDSI